MRNVRRLLADQNGSAAVELALIAALLSVSAIGAPQALAANAAATYSAF